MLSLASCPKLETNIVSDASGEIWCHCNGGGVGDSSAAAVEAAEEAGTEEVRRTWMLGRLGVATPGVSFSYPWRPALRSTLSPPPQASVRLGNIPGQPLAVAVSSNDDEASHYALSTSDGPDGLAVRLWDLRQMRHDEFSKRH